MKILYYTVHRPADIDINGDYFLLGGKDVAVYEIHIDEKHSKEPYLHQLIYFSCEIEDETEAEIRERLTKESNIETLEVIPNEYQLQLI